MVQEEQKLRDHPEDFMMDVDPFTNDVGHFWLIFPTREYMRARYALVEALDRVNTRDAVQAQLDHLLDMLRLCRGDNLGVRDLVPHLMLRLSQDQQCYDFVKWWSTTGQKPDYDWGDLDLPYLDTRAADVFESPSYLCHRFGSLSFLVAMTLMKTKLVLDLTEIRDTLRDYTAVEGQGASPEITKVIQARVLRSPLVAQLSAEDVIDATTVENRIGDLTVQIEMLYKTVNDINGHFWPALANPGDHLTARSGMYCRGSMHEMQVVLPYCYKAWTQTVGATAWILDQSRVSPL